MKNILFVILLAVCYTSCSQSPEEKANALIKQDLNKVLYHADSYDPVETVLDSAFTPFDDPALYKALVKAADLEYQLEKCKREMKHAKSSMAIWSDSYISAYGKTQYQEAKETYNEKQKRIEEIEKEGLEIAEKMKKIGERQHEFIGFKATHRYRAKNNSGDIVFGQSAYLFDKELTKIIKSYDMDTEEYKAVHAFINQLKGEE